MHSFTDLNGYNNSTSITYDDNRSASIEFNSSYGTDQHIGVKQGKNHILPLGIDILDIIKGESLNINLVINFTGFPIGSVDFGTLPDGLTLENIGHTYAISGITTKEQWDEIKYPTIISSSSTLGDFNYKVDITYISDGDKYWTVYLKIELGIELEAVYTINLNGTKLVSIPINMLSNYIMNSSPYRIRRNNISLSSNFIENIISTLAKSSSYVLNSINTLHASINRIVHRNFSAHSLFTIYSNGSQYSLVSNPSNFSYDASGTSYTINNEIAFNSNAPINDNFTLTITPTFINGINNATSSGSGGTFNYDNSTKVITITGTPSQINSHLNTINISHNQYTYYNYIISYYSEQPSDTRIKVIETQQIKPINTTTEHINCNIISSNFSNNINSSAPLITSTLSGNYTYKIYPYNFSGTINIFDTGYYTIESTYNRPGIINSAKISGDSSRYITTNTDVDEVTYIYSRSGSTWTADSSIPYKARSSAINYDGTRCALYTYNVDGTNPRVLIYSRSGTTWSLESTIQLILNAGPITYNTTVELVFDSAANRLFVYFPKIRGTTDKTLRIYSRSGTTWSLETSLITAPTYLILGLDNSFIDVNDNGDYFIVRYSISSSTQTAHVYNRSGTTWTNQATLVSSDTINSCGINSAGDKIMIYYADYCKFFSRSGVTWTLYDTVYNISTPSSCLKISKDFTKISSDSKLYFYNSLWYYKQTIDIITSLANTSNYLITTNSSTNAINYTTSSYGTWDNINKIYTVSGTYDLINKILNNIYYTSTDSMQLINEVITPTGINAYNNIYWTKI